MQVAERSSIQLLVPRSSTRRPIELILEAEIGRMAHLEGFLVHIDLSKGNNVCS